MVGGGGEWLHWQMLIVWVGCVFRLHAGVLSETLHTTWKPGLSPVTLMTMGLSLKWSEPALPLLTEGNRTVLPPVSFPEVGMSESQAEWAGERKGWGGGCG